MAFTGIAALVAGAEVTAPLVLAAVAEVGTSMALVGAVTGSKDLTQLGSAMGLVGGLGGMALGASSAAAAGASVGDATVGAAPDMLPDAIDAGGGFNPATGMGDAATATGAAAGDAAAAGGTFNAAMDSQAANTGIIGSAAQPVDPMAAAAAAEPAPALQPVLDPATGAPAQSAPDGATTLTPAGSTATPVAPVTNPAAAVTPNPNVNPTDMRLAAGTQAAPMGSSGYFNSILGVLQNPANKTTLELGAKLIGGAFQGMQGQSQFDQRLGLERDRLKQTSYGSQVGQNRPRGGIIAGARR